MPGTKKTIAINPSATALMSNGTHLDRPAILSKLGLDPHTPVDAWLAIVACGSNASALHNNDLRTIVSKGTLQGAAMTELKALAKTRGIG